MVVVVRVLYLLCDIDFLRHHAREAMMVMDAINPVWRGGKKCGMGIEGKNEYFISLALVS